MRSEGHDRLFERIVRDIPDAVVYADNDGIIRIWNAGAEEMFGYPAAEALGRPLDIIIPETLRARHWEGFRKVMETGVTRYGKELLAVPGVRKDGARISLEFSIALIRDGGSIVGAVAVLRDVTARWKRDKETRDRLAALEGRAGRE